MQLSSLHVLDPPLLVHFLQEVELHSSLKGERFSVLGTGTEDGTMFGADCSKYFLSRFGLTSYVAQVNLLLSTSARRVESSRLLAARAGGEQQSSKISGRHMLPRFRKATLFGASQFFDSQQYHKTCCKHCPPTPYHCRIY